MSLEDILTANTGRSNNIRVGRGAGTGRGKTCGRGHKGAGSRSGRTKHPLFEGGQCPLWMRLPKRGFSNARHRTVYQPVRLAKAVAAVDGDLSVESIIAAGLASKKDLIKLVGGDKIDKKLSARVHRVTKSVRDAIEAAGGSVEEINARG
ncbi:MAG: 50S ribosomal protein L15 [Planctomycetes bacterium]|nr:50S ribosomal protein L15 [Planctomycetota bacterium]